MHSKNVQCELYRKAVMCGLRPVLEYKQGNCRFDIVMTFEDKIFAIIEVKNYRRPYYIPPITKQMDKYSKWGLPLFLCRGFQDIDYIVAECVRLQRELKEEFFGG